MSQPNNFYDHYYHWCYDTADPMGCLADHAKNDLYYNAHDKTYQNQYYHHPFYQHEGSPPTDYYTQYAQQQYQNNNLYNHQYYNRDYNFYQQNNPENTPPQQPPIAPIKTPQQNPQFIQPNQLYYRNYYSPQINTRHDNYHQQPNNFCNPGYFDNHAYSDHQAYNEKQPYKQPQAKDVTANKTSGATMAWNILDCIGTVIGMII